MKKIILILATFIAIFSISSKTTHACTCGVNMGSCGMVYDHSDCTSSQTPVCQPSTTIPGSCASTSCICVDKSISPACSLIPDSCTASNPNTSCQCDTAGCSCKAKITPGTPSTTSSSVHGNCGDTKIDTAIGCIPVLDNSNGATFMGFILKWAVGIGGGIAFLLILYGGFMVMTSAGNPERLKAGQELLTSAISGLILLIFSIFILKFIGVDILGLGAFGFGKP